MELDILIEHAIEQKFSERVIKRLLSLKKINSNMELEKRKHVTFKDAVDQVSKLELKQIFKQPDEPTEENIERIRHQINTCSNVVFISSMNERLKKQIQIYTYYNVQYTQTLLPQYESNILDYINENSNIVMNPKFVCGSWLFGTPKIAKIITNWFYECCMLV